MCASIWSDSFFFNASCSNIASSISVGSIYIIGYQQKKTNQNSIMDAINKTGIFIWFVNKRKRTNKFELSKGIWYLKICEIFLFFSATQNFKWNIFSLLKYLKYAFIFLSYRFISWNIHTFIKYANYLGAKINKTYCDIIDKRIKINIYNHLTIFLGRTVYRARRGAVGPYWLRDILSCFTLGNQKNNNVLNENRTEH